MHLQIANCAICEQALQIMQFAKIHTPANISDWTGRHAPLFAFFRSAHKIEFGKTLIVNFNLTDLVALQISQIMQFVIAMQHHKSHNLHDHTIHGPQIMKFA